MSLPASCTEICRERVIALTGGIATGKSAVAKILREQNIPVFDADDLARELTSPGAAGTQAIKAAFGADMIDEGGGLRRDRMRETIHADANAKKKLEELLHPLIRELFCRKMLSLNPLPELIFWEAALIHEAGRAKDFASVWCTFCPEETQTKRLMELRHMSLASAAKAIATQMPAAQKASLSDVVIDTDKTLADTRRLTLEALQTFIDTRTQNKPADRGGAHS